MTPNPTRSMPEHDLELEATSFADRLVERHLAGTASVEELLAFDIDAQTIMRALLLARRAAARSPQDKDLAARCRSLDELYRQLRIGALKSETSSFGGRLIDTYGSRKAEVIELIEENGGYRRLETLPARFQSLHPRLIKRRVERRAMLMIGRDLRTGIFPSCQFLPNGQVVKDLPGVWAALGRCDQLAMIAFLLRPDPDIAGFQPIELLRAGRVAEVVTLASDRI